MGEFLVLSCNLSDALDRGNDFDHVFQMLQSLHGLLLADTQGCSDDFYESWFTLERAACTSPEAQGLVQLLAECATDGCNAREVFSLFAESLSLALSQEPRVEASCLPLQLHLLRMLPRLLLRMRRKWCAFLSDLLGLLLHWCAHVLPTLPWHQAPAHPPHPVPGSTGNGWACTAAGGEGLPQPADITLQAAVGSICEGLASLAAFVQRQQQQLQQPMQDGASNAPAAEAEAGLAAAGTAQVLSANDCTSASQLLLQSGLQLAAVLTQLPHSQAAAQVGVAAALAASPAAMGRRLEALIPAAAATLQLPSAILASLSPALLPALASTQALFDIVAEFEATRRQREQQRLLRLEGTEEGSSSGSTVEEEEEGAGPLDGREMMVGAALGLCAVILSTASAPGSGSAPLLKLALVRPGDQPAAALLKQLEPAVRALLDAGGVLQSISLTLLPLVCLPAACRVLGASNGSGSGGGSPCTTAALQDQQWTGHVAQQGQSEVAQQGQQVQSEVLGMLVHAMSFHPLELVRSCAHEALHALLDALAPVPRLEVVLGMLQDESGAAVVVALQRIRQEVAAAWDGTAAQGPSPFLSQAVLDLATESFNRGKGGRRWLSMSDVLSNADAMAAALALYRFVLLRQEGGPAAPAAAVQGQAQQAPCVLELSAESVATTLEQHLLPLQAATVQLLQEQGRALGDGGSYGGGLGAGQQGSEGLESWLALQRLLDVLERVVEIAERYRRAD